MRKLARTTDNGTGTATAFAELREARALLRSAVPERAPIELARAFAREADAAARLARYLRRGEPIPSVSLGENLVDVICYADLLAAALGIDLGEAVRVKLASLRHGSDVLR